MYNAEMRNEVWKYHIHLCADRGIFFFQAEDGIRDIGVTGVQTCALPICFRTDWAGDLRADRVGDELRVAGWVHRRRDHGGLIFIDLRDRTGLLQLVFRPEEAPDAHAAAERLRSEDVITAAGELVLREEGTVNPSLATGEVEINVAEVEQLADSETPPFPIDDDASVDEAL